MNAPALSVLIDAAPGVPGLAECLSSVAFAGERIVLVDEPGGESARLAAASGARVVQPGEDVAPAGTWLLRLSADMRVPPPLADEILATIAAPAAAYAIEVRNMVGGRWVRRGWTAALAAATVPCLYPRDGEQKPSSRLRGPVERHVAGSISALLRRLDHEATRRAVTLAHAGAGSLARAQRDFCTGFLASYLARGGFREGRIGLVVAICAALAPVLAHVKATQEQSA